MCAYRLSTVTLIFAILTPGPARAQKIYWDDSIAGRIYCASADGTGAQLVLDISPVQPTEIAIDRRGGKIYWTEYDEWRIRRANLDGSDIETVLITDYPLALAIDEVDRRVYWSRGFDSGLSVNRADFNGQNEEIIFPTDNASIEDIAIDTVGRKIYYTSGDGSVGRSNLDGSQLELVISENGLIYGLAVDPKGGKLYWTNIVENALRRANLDGSNIENLPISAVHPHDIAVDSCLGRIFWNEASSGALRTARFDGTNLSQIASGTDWLSCQTPFDESTSMAKCIPAVSTAGALVLGIGLIVSCIVVWRRRTGQPLCTIAVVSALVLNSTSWGDEPIEKKKPIRGA